MLQHLRTEITLVRVRDANVRLLRSPQGAASRRTVVATLGCEEGLGRRDDEVSASWSFSLPARRLRRIGHGAGEGGREPAPGGRRHGTTVALGTLAASR